MRKSELVVKIRMIHPCGARAGQHAFGRLLYGPGPVMCPLGLDGRPDGAVEAFTWLTSWATLRLQAAVRVRLHESYLVGGLVWLAMVTGARRGEMSALGWSDVDLDNALLTLHRSVGQYGGHTWEKDTNRVRHPAARLLPGHAPLTTQASGCRLGGGDASHES